MCFGPSRVINSQLQTTIFYSQVNVGRGAFLGGGSVLDRDLIPYGLAFGNRASLQSINVRGLRRHNTAPGEIRALLSTYRYLFNIKEEGYYPPLLLAPSSTIHGRALHVNMPQYPCVMELVAFILGERTVLPNHKRETTAMSNAGLCMPT